MMKLIFLAASFVSMTAMPVSFYSLSTSSVNNTILTMNSFQNKKILLVNVASNSPHAGQLRELEKFYQKHKDSVVVIVFPTNSFGKEPLNNQQLKLFFNSNIKAKFHVAVKSDVTGANANTIYQWLTSGTDNGFASYIPKRDFEKVLIARNGTVTGIFAPETKPLDDRIKKALQY